MKVPCSIFDLEDLLASVYPIEFGKEDRINTLREGGKKVYQEIRQQGRATRQSLARSLGIQNSPYLRSHLEDLLDLDLIEIDTSRKPFEYRIKK